MEYNTISVKFFFPAKGAIYYVAIATVTFSRVKISCFRTKAHLVFHWCLVLFSGLLRERSRVRV